MVSGYKHREHDGFSVVSSAPLASGKTPGFDEDHYGLTLGTRFDGSALFDAPARSVTLGVLANYTHTEIDVDAPAALPLSKGGSAEVDSWSVGGYGLVTDGRRYGLLTVTGTYGSPETDNAVLPATADFNNFGLATSAMTGILLSAGGNTKLDLRGGLTYVNATSNDYSDSNGISFTDARMEEFSGSLSARLFGVVQAEGYTLRPFVQTGLSHRFHYENELNIDGESFSFDEADSSVFARAGLDFNVDNSTQAYLAIRGDASEDYRSVEGQVGVTFKLD
jgi:outer membrane autotransporter protein